MTALDVLSPWLAPQARFDALLREAQKKHPRGLADLAYANAWDGPAAGAREALAAALEGDRALQLQYTPYGGDTLARRRVARWLDTTHAREGGGHHYLDVVLTPGAMAALHLVFRALAQAPGDEVVIVAPCWLDYPLYLAAQGLVPVLVPLTAGELGLDVAAVAAAIGPRTRAVILSQPANPTGRVYDDGELAALGDALAGTGVTLISDESHRSVSSVPVPAPARHFDDCVTVYSFGKSLGMQGQRTGFAAVSPRHRDREALRTALVTWVRALGFCTPTALMQRALPAILGLCADVASVDDRRQRLKRALEEAGYRVPRADATFFLYPEVPPGYASDEAFAAAAAHRGVLVLPGTVFHHTGAGAHFRVSVTATRAMMDDALPHLVALARGP